MNRTPEILSVALVWLAVIVIVHQQLFTNDVWFNFGQIWHHEPIIACLLVAAVALVLGKHLGKGKGKS
jgi:hypothetical protein